MSLINLQFTLQTLEGPNSNIVTLSRSDVNVLPLTNDVFEQVNIATNVADVQTTLPTIAGKVLTVENVGLADITVKFNSNAGTAFVLPKVSGTNTSFIAMVTTTAITSIFCSNADAINQGQLKVFVGG